VIFDDINANLNDALLRRDEARETFARALFHRDADKPAAWARMPQVRAELEAAERAYAMAYTARIEALSVMGRRY
jgi:hypothetical protein